LLGLTAGAGAQEEAGFVLDLSGEWVSSADQSRLLSPGVRLLAGEKVWLRNNDGSSYITISLYTGEAKKYSDAFELPKRVVPSLGSRVWNAVKGYYNRVVHTRSRGTAGELQDGVVRLKGEKIDVSSAFNKMAEGNYLIRIQQIVKDEINDRISAEASIKWKRGDVIMIPAQGVSPGLYMLSIWEKLNSRLTPTGDNAWVLIVHSSKYKTVLTSYNEAVSLTRKWGNTVEPEAVHSFLRAYIQFLSSREQEQRRGRV
jgi:hypothetical protein